MEEIKIAGAGIAGLSAAIILSKNGYQVKVFEKNQDVGRRFNGDFQGLMNWGFEEDILDFMEGIGLEIDFWKIPVRRGVVLGPGDCQSQIESDKPIFYLIRRGIMADSLDIFFKELAAKNNVEIIFDHPINNKEVDIIATGLPLKRKPDGMVLGYVFESDSEDIFIAVFDKEVAHQGYAYCFIINGQGTIATCSFGNFSKINNHLEKAILLLRRKFNFNIENPKIFFGIENFHLPNGDKKIIGEAGGFLDFLFGFGMRYAILSGQLAAESIIYGKKFNELRRKELEDLIKTSISNRFFYTVLGGHSYPYKYFVERIGQSENPRKMLTKIYRPNFLSRLIYPLAKVYFTKNLRA